MTEVLPSMALLRLLQLASPSLPVGAYAYSQGLEWAVEAGWVSDEPSLAVWLRDQLRESIGAVDLPVFARLYEAAASKDLEAQREWSRRLVAMRETSELIRDDCARGQALAVLLRDLGIEAAADWVGGRDTPFAALAAMVSAEWQIPLEAAAQATAWSWLENQVLAGLKLVPLGQVAGQRLLLNLADEIPEVCRLALARDDDDIGGSLAIVAIASSRHETQYTRLFRS